MSLATLQMLYGSLIVGNEQNAVIKFLKTNSSLDYPKMVTALNDWYMAKFSTYPGLGLGVCNADGVAMYYSGSSHNQFENINKFAASFNSLIYENFNYKSYGMGAMTNESGTFVELKYNSAIGGKVILFSVRQGVLNEPFGAIIIRINEDHY